MVRKYFGTDGIRGRANGVITPELALKVGQAAGLVFRRGDHRHRVLIGKDTRLSGYMIETALVAGFTSVGMDVLLTGPIPTPAVAHAHALDARRSRRDDLGLAQPVRRQRHQAVRSRRLQALRRGRARDRGADRCRPGQEAGEEPRISAAPSASTACRTATSNSPSARCRSNLSLEGLRVVVDCANGAAYRVAPEALWELGAEVISIGVEPDGFNINRECGSTEPAALCQQGARRCAPISASRSTATPTACSSPTSAATSSTATSCWR